MDVTELLGRIIEKIPKKQEPDISAQKTLLLDKVWQDGIVRVVGTPPVYSKTIRFSEINYTLLDEDSRRSLLDSFGRLFHLFEDGVHLQMTYAVVPNDTAPMESFQGVSADHTEIAAEYSSFLRSQMVGGMKIERYLTFSINAGSPKEARSRLKIIENSVMNALGDNRLGANPTVLNGEERIELYKRMLSVKGPFSWHDYVTSDLTAVDYVAPSSFSFHASKWFKIGNRVGAVYFFRMQTSALGDGTLMNLLRAGTDMTITFHIDAIERDRALRMVKRKMTDVNMSKIDEQKKAVRSGYDMEILPTDLNAYSAGLESMLKSLRNGGQHAYYMTMLLYLMADNEAQLHEKWQKVESIARQRDLPLTSLDYQQEEGLVSSLPLGINNVSVKRMVTTSVLAAFVPFQSKQLCHPGTDALYCGTDPITGNIIRIDRKQGSNPNGLIFGKPGSGKSFAAKMEIFHAYLGTDDDIMICDPEAEYAGMAQALGGQRIRIAQNAEEHINPMDINLDSDEDEPLKLKSDFLLSLCELIVGGKEGLRPIEKSVIDRCIPRVYAKYLSDPKPENMPILEDLYLELKKQETGEARFLADSMEMYVGEGSLNVFNHRTNIDIQNRMVVFDIKDLGKQSKKLGMLIVQDAVWNRVSANRKAKKYTRYYMDEIHLLLKDEQTAAYTVEIWKRFRKWGGIPTGITQNVTDLLASREIENIFGNSEYIQMLSQGDGDREVLCDKLRLSDAQLSYITDRAPGEGLIRFGSTVVPFENHFPRESKMYAIMNTRLTERDSK